MAIDRRKKKSQHERQTGSAATATATKTGVTVPKITPPSTPSYYGGGGSQAVKPYTSQTPATSTPSTAPKTTTPTTTGTSSASNLPPLPTIFDITKSHITGEPWPTTPTYSFGSLRGSTSGSPIRSTGGSTGGSSRRGTTPTIDTTKFAPDYSSTSPYPQWEQGAGMGDWTINGDDFGGGGSGWGGYGSYREELANLRDEELALAARLHDQFMKQMDSLIGEYMQYYEQMGQGIDPATEAALTRLKEEMSNDQRMIMEYLNAKGIAQSGIAAEEVGRLAGSYTDKKSQMLAQRLTDLQNQFLSSMQNFMSQKIQGMGQYTQNAMGAQQRYTQGMQGAMQNAMDMTFSEWQRQQQERAAMEQSMIPYTQGPTPYQQQQIGLQRQSQSQQAAYQNQQAQRAAQQQQAQAATNEAISKLSSYPSREAAEASIRNTAQGLAQMGVDIQALYKALDMYWPINNLNQYFNE